MATPMLLHGRDIIPDKGFPALKEGVIPVTCSLKWIHSVFTQLLNGCLALNPLLHVVIMGLPLP
jgi:hypothetical protein